MNNGVVRRATVAGDVSVRAWGGFGNDNARGYPGDSTWDSLAWRAAWARARAGGGQAHIACFGDSVTEGYLASDWTNRWTEVMQARIAAATSVPVGTGIVPLTPWSIGNSTDTRFSGTPGVWREGNNVGGFLNVATWDYNNAPGSYLVTFTPTQSIDSFVVWTAESHEAGTGTCDVEIDSVAVDSGLVSGGVPTLKRREYAVTPGVHTLGWRSNPDVNGVRQYVVGFEGVRNASRGVKVTTAGLYGSLMTGHDDNVSAIGSKAANNWSLFQLAKIDLFVWAFGLNEWNNTLLPETLTAKFDAFAQYQRTTKWPCSVVLLVQLPPSDATQRWDAYCAAIRTAAAKYGWGLIDVTAEWGVRANKVASYGDTVHPTNAGYAEIGNLAADVILAPVVDL